MKTSIERRCPLSIFGEDRYRQDEKPVQLSRGLGGLLGLVVLLLVMWLLFQYQSEAFQSIWKRFAQDW